MKKLTDEVVAKALGWKNLGSRKIGSVIEPITHKGWWYPNGDFFSYATPPPFTTSLDAIVAEIEARGLYWIVARQFGGEYWASIRTKGAIKVVEKEGQTAPLALCQAILSYPKEKP